MWLLRSFNRFLLFSLALYGLSTLTVNAALIDGGSVTRDDESGLEWLDLTLSTNRSYNDVSGEFGIGGDYEGWRYASTTEIGLFFTHAGGTVPFTGLQGDDEAWIAELLGLWGVTTASSSPLHPASEALSGTSHAWIDIDTGFHVGVWGAALAIDVDWPNQNGLGDYALIATLGPYTTLYSMDTSRPRLASALVRSYVPIPAAVWLFGTALIGLIGFGKRKARIAA